MQEAAKVCVFRLPTTGDGRSYLDELNLEGTEVMRTRKEKDTPGKLQRSISLRRHKGPPCRLNSNDSAFSTTEPGVSTTAHCLLESKIKKQVFNFPDIPRMEDGAVNKFGTPRGSNPFSVLSHLQTPRADESSSQNSRHHAKPRQLPSLEKGPPSDTLDKFGSRNKGMQGDVQMATNSMAGSDKVSSKGKFRRSRNATRTQETPRLTLVFNADTHTPRLDKDSGSKRAVPKPQTEPGMVDPCTSHPETCSLSDSSDDATSAARLPSSDDSNILQNSLSDSSVFHRALPTEVAGAVSASSRDERLALTVPPSRSRSLSPSCKSGSSPRSVVQKPAPSVSYSYYQLKPPAAVNQKEDDGRRVKIACTEDENCLTPRYNYQTSL